MEGGVQMRLLEGHEGSFHNHSGYLSFVDNNQTINHGLFTSSQFKIQTCGK
jgi:hypothetical protein